MTVNRKPGRPKGSKSGPRKARTPQQDRKVSIRGVVEPEELRFCQVYLAFGKRDAAEAYRRAYLRKNGRGDWVDVPRGSGLPMEEINEMPVLNPKLVGKRAAALLRQQHIQEVLFELEQSPSEHARQTLADQILFGSEREKSKALERIIAEEDKLGFRDASEVWADIMCSIGAEVVVPLGKTTKTVHCPACGETSRVQVDLAAEVQLSEFFPRAAAPAE